MKHWVLIFVLVAGFAGPSWAESTIAIFDRIGTTYKVASFE